MLDWSVERSRFCCTLAGFTGSALQHQIELGLQSQFHGGCSASVCHSPTYSSFPALSPFCLSPYFCANSSYIFSQIFSLALQEDEEVCFSSYISFPFPLALSKVYQSQLFSFVAVVEGTSQPTTGNSVSFSPKKPRKRHFFWATGKCQ